MKRTLFIALALLIGITADAQLTVSVTPGYRFNSSENITLSKLNSLGQPTVSVAGTVTGSSLAAGGVDAIHITTNATDRVTILGGYDGTSDTRLRVSYDTNTMAVNAAGLGVKSNSVTATQLATSAVGAAQLATNSVSAYHLATNFAIALTNLPTGVTNRMLWADTNGQWQLLTVGPGLVITNNTLTPTNNTTFVSGEYPLATGRTATNHTLGALPATVDWVLVCKTNDVGYTAGEEIPIRSFSDANASAFATGGASSTNVFFVMSTPASTLYVVNGTNGTANANPTAARWRVKCYAKP